MGDNNDLAAAWNEILRTYRLDEAPAVAAARDRLTLTDAERRHIAAEARKLAAAVRAESAQSVRAEAFLQRYNLSTREGVVLMCLAEALLRIPDTETADALIRDKLAGGRWEVPSALEGGGSALMNAASWALMLTGRLVEWHDAEGGADAVMRRLVARAGEPLVRAAIRQAVEIMAGQFVAGETIAAALERARREPGFRFSYDMLGEAAKTTADAGRYLAAYHEAIVETGAEAREQGGDIESRPGLSIKLSALHPRYEIAQHKRVLAELLPRLLDLAGAAARAGIPITIDAEESDRLTLSLELFERVAREPALAGWDGLGLAVQAYQKRAPAVCDWLAALADASGRRIMVRLVKGAYWDTEIKIAQVLGVGGYPVYTRKSATDVSYMACAQTLLAAGDRVFPQFATHNCHTVAFILACVGERRAFEFQKLHGMGDALYDVLVPGQRVACRVYAPVGSHRDLLAYLVRRLLENGANTSFVHQVADSTVPLERLAADPLALLPDPYTPNPRVPLPQHIYPNRLNSRGADLSDVRVLQQLEERIARDRQAVAATGAAGGSLVYEPADRRRIAGATLEASPGDVHADVEAAAAAWRGWDETPATGRAAILDRAAGAMEESADELVSLLVREAGRCLPDAAGEVREAVDFLRYYATQARAGFAAPLELPGPAGESNRLELAGRGVFACVSPWNFPLAIFTGQVSAALAAGNAVVAKPAEQTPLIATRATTLLHEAGVPRDVLRIVAGPGETVGAALVGHPRVSGVAFTGSFETALAIHRALAARDGPVVPFIAETGGLNAMVVDSSALPEQVVTDVLASAFNSAGQRCSALRILLVQEDAAPRVLDMLAGAMMELRVGDPGRADTDVGPVIDEAAKRALERHIALLERRGPSISRAPLGGDAAHGTFVAPVAFEIALEDLPRQEVFGPVLHVVRYAARDLERALAAVAATRYGLTLGIHSRLDTFVARVREHLRAGNTYVNRNMIGAVVGVQPFGGEGLSGTGPKAGGPHYLPRFAVERTLTINTAAVGGNADLLAGNEDPEPP
ncbi:MAG TPA: bifunctional proline dehydrogenase/L-glutamate gamma-semialdehyde dehydrogenase PutA [Burkholderiales bacterium]|nr:bifunctional proline dehydrogenase/L-glutamate gamma-semialdehyde dehydrogenase PutA [Burkholderiales bacterium]